MKFYDKDFNITQGYIRWTYFLLKKNIVLDINVLLIFIKDYNDMVDNGTITSYMDKAKEINIDFIMLEDPHNYPNVPDYVYQSPIKTFLLHNDFSIDNAIEPSRLYWPNWLFFVQDKDEEVEDINLIYPLSSANRNICYRPGKIYNYVQLKKQPYFNQILFSKFKVETVLDCHWPRPEDTEFEAAFQNLKAEYDSWPELDNDLLAGMAALNIPVYTKSLFHLVAESGVKENLISEKTYKIFHVKQIPIFCGARNLVKHLRILGFDTFDDIITHDYYDNIAEFKQRIDSMQTLLPGIIGSDQRSILQKTAQRRQKNYEWLHSHSLSDMLSESILSRLSYELKKDKEH